MTFSKTTFVDNDATKKVTASFLNTFQDRVLAHSSFHGPGSTDSVFPAVGSAGYVYQSSAGALSLATPGGTGDVTGPSTAVNGHLAVFDGNTGKLIKDGGLPASIKWTALASSTDFATTAPSVSTITMTADWTATLKVGSPILYTLNSTQYPAIITALTTTLMTIAGPAGLTTGAGLLTAISYGDPSRVVDKDIKISGYWNDGTITSLISGKIGTPFYWGLGPAALVQVEYAAGSVDTGATQPTMQIAIGGSNELSTAVAPSTTTTRTVVNLSTSYYSLTKDTQIEVIVASDGTNKDGWALGVKLSAVML